MALNIGELVGYVRLDTAGVAQGAQDTVEQVRDLGTKGKAAALAAGGLIGLSIGSAISESLDADAGTAKLGAQLGATAGEAEQYGASAGRLYSAAYGGNLGEVNDAIAAVVKNVGGMADASSADLERISGKVLNTADVFGQDLGQVTRAVGTMMRTGMARDADEALDIITAGLQSNANTADDLLDTYNEYSTQFRKVGLDGKDALGLIQQGLQGGARDADLVADAVKEFSIRAVDGSAEAAAAYDALGFNAGEMTAKIAAGGPAAREALGQVLDRLRENQGAADYATIAFGLFGTQSEDLGAALGALDLDTATAGMDDLAGAADRVDDAVGNTAKASLDSFMRSVQTGIVDLVGDVAIPILEQGADAAANVFGPALDVAGGAAGLLGSVMSAIPGPVRDTAIAMGVMVAFGPAIVGFFTSVGTSAAAAYRSVAQGALVAAGAVTASATSMAVAGGIARAGMAGFATMLGGPVGLAIVGIVAGLSVLSSLTSDNAEETEGAAAAQGALAAALRESNGVIDDNVRKSAAKDAQDKKILASAEKAGIPLALVTEGLLGNSAAYDEVIASLNAYADAQTTTIQDAEGGVTTSITAAGEAARTAAGEYQTLAGTLPETAEKELQLAEASGEAATQHELAADAAAAQDEALQNLKDTFDEWTGKAISAAEAQISVNDGLRAFTDNVVENGTSLQANTAAGDANRSQILDQITAIQDLSTATFDQTGKVEDARGAYDREMGALRQRLVELGYNEQAVDDMIAAYGRIPEEEWTRVYADTGPAQASLSAFMNQRRSIQLKVNLERGTMMGGLSANTGLYEAVGGIVKKYAAGGIELTPMSGGLAQIVPPNTWRVVGDRPVNDEFFIPDDEAPRSIALGAEWARRRGYDLVPADVAAMAAGGVVSGSAGPATSPVVGTRGPRVVVHDNRQVYAQVDAAQLARAMAEQTRDDEFLDGEL